MKNFQNKNIEKAIEILSKNDPILSIIIKNNSMCNLQMHKNFFNTLIQSIIGQQLSIKSAASIIRKFFHFFNNHPLPENILTTSDRQLRNLGLSNAKTRYVKDLAQKIITKQIILKGISNKSNEKIIEELTKVTGIGIWTVHMFLIFTLGRLDVLPYSDLGIKKAIMINYSFKTLPTNEDVIKLAAKNGWHPYHSVAAWYLWRTLD